MLLAALICSLTAFAGVTLVPTAPLVGDGDTQATVRLFVDSGAKVKVKAEAGKVGAVAVGEDGIVTVLYTPPTVTAAKTIEWKITGGGEDATVQIPVVPALKGDLTLSFDPPVLSSTGGTALVRIQPSSASPIAAEGRRFALVASAGTVEAVTPAGDGTWVARYTPPKAMTAPAPVLFLAADAAAPDKVLGNGILPVTVKRSVTYDAKPGASCVLSVGSRQYGPFVASTQGKVAFDVELSPSEPEGLLRVVNTDTSTEDRKVPLPIGEKPQIAFSPMANAVPTTETKVEIRVRVVQKDGRLANDAAPRIAASKGSVEAPVERDGYWVATLTPPSQPGEILLTAEAEGVKVERKLKIVAALPSVALESEAPEISAKASTFKVVARVKDANGTSLPGRMPAFSAQGGVAAGAPKDNGDGSYTSTWRLSPGATSVRIDALPPLEATGLPPVKLLVWPASGMVAANGIDEVLVNVVAVDRYGLPVPNVTLRLGVPKGDGSLPPSASTDARGVARVYYKAGRTAGIVSLRAEGGGLVTEAPLFQSTNGMSPSLPVAADAATEALLARWQAAAPSMRIYKEGVVPPSGPPAALAASTVPPFTTPGAAILLNVRIVDSAGKGVAGQKLQIAAAPANVGPIADNRDGTYTVTLQLPAGVDGPVQVTVAAGSLNTAVALPTLAALGSQAVAAQPQGASAQPSPLGGSAATVKPAKQQKAGGELAAGRVAVSLVNLRGHYQMTSDAGAQLLGAAAYDTPAMGFWALNLAATWYPVRADFGWIGLDVRGRGQLEMVEVLDTPFVNLGRDVVAGALYRKPLGNGLFSVQAGLGLHHTTGTLFRYSDAELSEAELLNFPLYGARLAGGAIVETGAVAVSAEVAETFVPFPVDTHAELGLDYTLADSGFGLRGSVGWDLRTMTFEASAGDGGEAEVWQQQFAIGVGGVMVF
ncbi:MAG: Ig-like domain-containing protein [Myxococcota bacterium]